MLIHPLCSITHCSSWLNVAWALTEITEEGQLTEKWAEIMTREKQLAIREVWQTAAVFVISLYYICVWVYLSSLNILWFWTYHITKIGVTSDNYRKLAYLTWWCLVTYLWNSLVKSCKCFVAMHIKFNKSGKWSDNYTFSTLLISTWRRSYSRFQLNNNQTISYFITKHSKDSGSGEGGWNVIWKCRNHTFKILPNRDYVRPRQRK